MSFVTSSKTIRDGLDLPMLFARKEVNVSEYMLELLCAKRGRGKGRVKWLVEDCKHIKAFLLRCTRCTALTTAFWDSSLTGMLKSKRVPLVHLDLSRFVQNYECGT